MKAARPLSVLALCAAWFGMPSCFDDNPASYQGILGRSVRERHEPTPTGGTAPGTGGAGVVPTGGSQPSAGGAPGGEGGVGDGGIGATGGSSAGKGGSAGTTDNPPPHPDYMPPCFLGPTLAGEEIMKGTPCTPADVQMCFRPCGPLQVGWKKEICQAGVYAEEDCFFPDDRDYSCFALPAMIDEQACGITAPPAATDECTAPSCMPCNFANSYQDTGGDVKEGYCVCREPDGEGVRRWTCASTMAWPCPSSRGCF